MTVDPGISGNDAARSGGSTSERQPAKRYCELATPGRNRVSKEFKVRAVTIAVLVAAAMLVIGFQSGWQMGSSSAILPSAAGVDTKPQDVIYRMLDAAKQGDAEAYLGCYDGPTRRRLEQSRDEMTAAGFSQYLIASNKPIKGIAISEPSRLSEQQVEVRVEFIYQDLNEAQQFLLDKSPAGWKIARVNAAERVETLVPYGTPVD